MLVTEGSYLDMKKIFNWNTIKQIPVAEWSEVCVCGCSRAGIVGSEHVGGMHVDLLGVLCVVCATDRFLVQRGSIECVMESDQGQH